MAFLAAAVRGSVPKAMISSRCLGLLVCILLMGEASAQPPASPLTPVNAAEERAAKVAERYKAMLQANPVEGLALDRLWKSYDERGASAGLIDEYRRLAEAPGTVAAPVLVYGYLLQRAGRLDEAAANYEHAETLDPASPLPPLARANLALVRSQAEEAAGFFGHALEKLPAGDRRQPEILQKLGAAWMSAGQPLKAAESWEQIVAHDPANVGLRRQLAENYERNGLPERALVHYAYIEAHAEPAERAAALRDLARLHAARGEFEPARDALERGLTLTARDNWLHGDLETRLIRLYQRAGRVPELEARWRAAAAAAPHDLGAALSLEALAEAQGDPGGERTALENLVALAPRNADYLLKLARRLADDGDRTRAAALYDGLLKLRPDALDLILARADLDLQLGQPTAAVGRIEVRIARNPADDSLTIPALAFFLEHHLDAAAEKCLRAATARQPTAAEPALALAKFLFAQRKGAEARATLAALTSLSGDAAARAVRWTEAAEIFREQNLAADALHAWQEAATLQPQSAAPSLAAGEFLLAHGDRTAAAELFARAATLTTGPEQTAAERKLFGVLQSVDDPADDGGRVDISPDAGHLGRSLGDYLSKLEKTAASAPTSDHLLRLARWQFWARRLDAALASANRAITADPANIAARELVVDVAVELRHPADAETQLQALATRDPAHGNDYLRRLANLRMDGGDFDAAVAIFTQLQQASPASREALADLALAEQRADRWYDALGAWERADALPGGTRAQREDVRRSLLSTDERLGQFSRAAELLRGAVDAQTDLAAKTDAFRELAAFWHRHDLGPGLREEYEKRLAVRSDDYFLLTALAELRREDGRERDAFALLKQAYYSSPDPVRSLCELADQAEQLGDSVEAVFLQRRLVALSNQATAANLEKLALLEDANGEKSSAAGVWEAAVAKFPRDTTLLAHAADFFQKANQPDRARALLAQLVAVDGKDNERLLTLGKLDAQAGDVSAARAHFDQLLRQTTPETAGETLLVPSELEAQAEPLALFGSGGPLSSWHGAASERTKALGTPESEERRLRLQAIESLSRLLFPERGSPVPTPDAAQTAWLQRWQTAAADGAKSEPLAAFYFSACLDPTLDLLERWVARDGATDEKALHAFLMAGFRLGGYERLGAWAWQGSDRARNAIRGQKLAGALQSYLRAGGKPGPGIVPGLFPADARVQEILWAAAQNAFAASHWYVQAAELGERVLANASSDRANYAVEVAQWELYAANPARAKEALRRCLEEVDEEGHELGDPVFVALRGYYLLLPESDRPAFVAEYLGRRHLPEGSVQAVLSAVLLHGLSGADEAARRNLDQLLNLRMLAITPLELSPDIRRWSYLLACGEQLERWHLDPLAIHLWRGALKEAGAFDQQISDVDNTVQEIRHRLLHAEVATAADPQQARERIQEYLAGQTEPAVINSTAAQLWNDGQHEAAARLYEIFCQTEPKNTDYWPNLSAYYEHTGNQDAAERLLGLMLAGKRALPPGVNRAELIGDLAALHEKRGDADGAIRLLERAWKAMPGMPSVLFQLAQTDERANRWDEAANAWREGLKLELGSTACLGLAAVEEHRGNRVAAVEVLRGGLQGKPGAEQGELAIRLTQTLLADHRAEEANRFALDLLDQGQLEPLPAIGAAFAAAGQEPVAHDLLSAAVLRTHDPTTRFRLQRALVEQAATTGANAVDFERQMRRLGKFAQASAALRDEYDALLYPLAHRQGAESWLESELRRDWKDGQGDPAAGVRLAALFLQSHRDDSLREVVQAIDRRADLPEGLHYALATSLVESDHAPLALALCERLAARFPQKLEYTLEQAQALWKNDRHPEANERLSNLAGLAVFRQDVLEPIAVFYLQHGEKALAVKYLDRIVQDDPSAVRAPQSWLRLAGIALDENRVSEAGRLLRVVYARPAADDLGPLVRYLKASGRLDGERAQQMPAPEFPLTFVRRAHLLAAVSDELNRSGRAADGRRLLETHAEFLGALPALAKELAQEAAPADIGTIADDLERAIGQQGRGSAGISHTLATVYVQWAAWDANDPATENEAFAHLSRAVALEPDNFAWTCQLAKLCVQRKQPEQAAAVLTAFLAPEALPSEREQARQILAVP